MPRLLLAILVSALVCGAVQVRAAQDVKHYRNYGSALARELERGCRPQAVLVALHPAVGYVAVCAIAPRYRFLCSPRNQVCMQRPISAATARHLTR